MYFVCLRLFYYDFIEEDVGVIVFDWLLFLVVNFGVNFFVEVVYCVGVYMGVLECFGYVFDVVY